MDLSSLSRRELQALCKSNGIPANKTNVFMVDALAKKRIPLSKMDVNRDTKPINSIGSPPLLARNIKTVDVSSASTAQQKPPLFQNNFLRRGKRKDAPTNDHEEKPKVQSSSKVSIDPSQRPPAVKATQVANMTTNAAQLRPNQMVSTKAKADSGLSDMNCETLSGTDARESKLESGVRPGTAAKGPNVTKHSPTSSYDRTSDGCKNGAEGNIVDRVRAQIDAVLCSKVMKAPERWPSAPKSLEPSERATREDDALTLALTSTPYVHAAQRSAPLEVTSPPISFSPLVVRVEEKVLSIIERVENFWKGDRDLAVVTSFGSPMQ